MLHHIIIEGPDGSGKTGFIQRMIQRDPGLRLRPRASTSLDGPVSNLTEWQTHELAFMQKREMHNGVNPMHRWIYDRHPLISERIYAAHARRVIPQGKFAEYPWVQEQRKLVAEHCIVVFCLPPLHTVIQNVIRTPSLQMPGVVDRIEAIYHEYMWLPKKWPGEWVSWDYTHMDFVTKMSETLGLMLHG